MLNRMGWLFLLVAVVGCQEKIVQGPATGGGALKMEKVTVEFVGPDGRKVVRTFDSVEEAVKASVPAVAKKIEAK